MSQTSGLPISLDNLDPRSKGTQLNSPRSIEACRRQGILPRELMYNSKTDYGHIFASEGLDDKNLQIRYEHMEKRRQEKMKICVEERLKLIEMQRAGMDPFAVKGSFNNQGVSSGPGRGLVEREARMIAKMRQNQQKEIEQMMQQELAMQALRQKNEEKARAQAQREAERLREVGEKRKEAEEKRLRYEEEKRIKLQEEEKARRRQEEEWFMQEKVKEEDQKRQARAKREEARKAALEQQRKQEEFKMATEKILNEQRKEVLRKKEEMDMKDAERRRKLEEERKHK